MGIILRSFCGCDQNLNIYIVLFSLGVILVLQKIGGFYEHAMYQTT